MGVVPARRIRRSARVAESKAPHANVAEIARRHDTLPQHLYAWRREAFERMEASDDTAFVPAVVDQSAKPKGALTEITINPRGMAIWLPDGASANLIECATLIPGTRPWRCL